MAPKSPLKKVLIITYYWPPMGGGGVQRWLKTTKYLREFGWEPIIFTANKGEGAFVDEKISSEIPENIETHRVNIWEPFKLYKKFTGKNQDKSLVPGEVASNDQSWSHKLSVWIRGNFFIPDARMFWINPSVRYLNRYFRNNKVDVMVSTGPPHSTHLIALKIIRKHPIPWLADFRDPWTNIDFYDKLKLTKWADKKHHQLESLVLQNADRIITVSQNWAQDFSQRSGVGVGVIINGFDPQDFEEAGKLPLDEKFTITHAGSLNEDRNPPVLWEALGELCKENPGFGQSLELHLIGQVTPGAIESLERNGLTNNYTVIKHMPHSRVIIRLMKSQVLLLLLNNTPNVEGIIPGKLYEYIGSGRPVLCIGSKTGDAARIIAETQAGRVVDWSEKEKIKGSIMEWYQAFREGGIRVQTSNYQKYSRRLLAGKFAEELDRLAEM